MKDKIKLISATVENVASMSTIHARSWKKAYRGLLLDHYLDSIPDDRWISMLSKGIAEKTIVAWIAFVKVKPAGCVCIGESSYPNYQGQCELISIYVLPEYWRAGIGSLLMKQILKYARSHHYLEIGLWVLEGNNQAIKFYERFDFFLNQDNISCEIGAQTTTELRYIKKLSNY